MTNLKIRRIAKPRPQVEYDTPLGSHSTDHVATPLEKVSMALTLLRQTVSGARLLIASIGNPAPLENTRHSAGHILLNALQISLRFPPLRRDHFLGNGHATRSPDIPQYTLWRSPSSMNTSGPGVYKAWRAFNSLHDSSGDGRSALVLLHDELELGLGKMKVRKGLGGSARGHNGIKSIQDNFRGGAALEENKLIRIGIGIGRPESRERLDVSDYVLGKVGPKETEVMKEMVGPLLAVLAEEARRIDDGGKREEGVEEQMTKSDRAIAKAAERH